MQILICNSKKIVKQAIATGDVDYYTESIKNNIDMLYHLSFLPEAKELQKRLQENGSDKNISSLLRKHFSSLYFVRMMTEEILNDLSNILEEDMQNVSEENMASIQEYIGNIVVPWFSNKFLQNDFT
jgi:hypothetical protein